jgi:hypothetical protein
VLKLIRCAFLSRYLTRLHQNIFLCTPRRYLFLATQLRFFNIVTLRKSMPHFATKNPNENQIKLPTYLEPILLYSNSHPSDPYSLTTPPGDLLQFHNLGNVRQSRSGWSCRRYREAKGLVGSEAYHSTICCHPHTTPPTTEYHQSTVIRMWKRTA